MILYILINIRPVSDLRNKFPEVEETVITTNSPVFLTKNGYGTMVLMSIEQYSALTDPIEYALDEADSAAKESKIRYSGADVFRRVRERIDGRKYKLTILPLFEEELNHIVDYITYVLHNREAAHQLITDMRLLYTQD